MIRPPDDPNVEYWLKSMINVGKHSIHGADRIEFQYIVYIQLYIYYIFGCTTVVFPSHSQFFPELKTLFSNMAFPGILMWSLAAPIIHLQPHISGPFITTQSSCRLVTGHRLNGGEFSKGIRPQKWPKKSGFGGIDKLPSITCQIPSAKYCQIPHPENIDRSKRGWFWLLPDP